MIKKILIGAGIVVVAGGLTVGAFALVNHLKPKAIATQTQSQQATTKGKTVLDTSKDYGACTITNTASIKTALGSVAASLQEPQNEGIVKNSYLGDNLKNIVSDSQSCVFAFASGGTIDNGFNATNGLVVTKTVFTNSDGPAALIAQTKKDSAYTQINNLGDAAFYTSSTNAKGPNATDIFELTIFKASESTDYIIQVPADKATLKADTAKTALVSLAQ